MFLVIGSDDASRLSCRRFLYNNNVLSVSCHYRNLPDFKDFAELEAVILSDPYDTHMPTHFPYVCHTHFPHTPVAALCQPLRDAPPDSDAIDIMISTDLAPHKLVEHLLLEVSRYHGRDIADHMKKYARDHLLDPAPLWRGYPLYLTQTERMIFRYLIDNYPRPITAKELLRYCVKPGTMPQLCIIPTHIYHINQKAKAEFHEAIISGIGGSGYQFTF